MTPLSQHQMLGDEALIDAERERLHSPTTTAFDVNLIQAVIDAARERLHSPTTTAFDVNLIQALVERLEDAIAELGDVTRD